MRKTAMPLTVLALCAALPVRAATPPVEVSEEFSAEVVTVIDGDTLEILRDGREIEIRLAGVDAPEPGQPYDALARNGLAHAVLGKVVNLQILARDLDTCPLARIYLGEIDVNLELVKAGLAWHNRWRVLSDKAFSDAQKEARKAGRGLWQKGPRPIPPWEYRQALEEAEKIDLDRHTDPPGYIPPRGPGGD